MVHLFLITALGRYSLLLVQAITMLQRYGSKTSHLLNLMRNGTLLILALLAIVSCRKSGNAHADLFRTWTWTHSTGGFRTSTITPDPDSIITLTLKPNNTFEAKMNGRTTSSGPISIRSENNFRVLHLSNFAVNAQLYLEQNDVIIFRADSNLVLGDYRLSDGYTHYFN